ncbi:MAG: hypothetical protein LKJ50_03500 [Clostridiales bacterium]|jgi:hypothetical protein|nr:hypothetical protein [Clostridiales bacterium]MCI1961009.1 hypothetical protein [Clostridiales bacterium]MCI2021450.1 hypothetical protein [Clostridiales bacterium]MCI2026236.1 hypothetical protein [Clostridiales bacterium]
MTGLEKIRWAKSMIEEESGGAYEFVVGNVHDDLYLRCGDHANAGLYLSILPNQNTGNYDCVFKGYTRISGGYHNAKGIQQLADEYKQTAYFLREMEIASISLTEDELSTFVAELKSAEEEQIEAPQMGM